MLSPPLKSNRNGFVCFLFPSKHPANRRQCLIWDIGQAQRASHRPSHFAKFRNVAHCSIWQVSKRTMLLTDGAKSYPKVAAHVGLLHDSVNHDKGEFVKDAFRGREKVVCHTGTIDSAWSSCKAYVPTSLPSCSLHLLLYVKSWQWRCVLRQLRSQRCAKSRQRTGDGEWPCFALAKRKTPPKVCPFLGEVSWGINVRFAEVKRKFFKKASKRERVFRSAGLFVFVCVCLCVCVCVCFV